MLFRSSAQNLLSGFKVASGAPSSSSAAGGAPPPPPPPSAFPNSSTVSTPGLPYPPALPTPTTATMPGQREWDVQSLYSDGVNSAAGSAIQTNGSVPQGTSVEFLRELVKKRIITLTYLRNVHEGCVALLHAALLKDRPGTGVWTRRSHWFHTIMITRAELDRAFTNVAMKQR